MEAKDSKFEINILSLNNDIEGHDCGYCHNPTGSCSFEMVIKDYPVEIYEKMMKDGWRRCGNYVYIPNIEKSCCKLYTCRLNVEDFKINKEQRKVMRRFRNYLSGEYELNKEKMKEEKKKDVEMKEVDEKKAIIEGVLKKYVETKKYKAIIAKYIQLDNAFLESQMKDLHVRKNLKIRKNLIWSYFSILSSFTKVKPEPVLYKVSLDINSKEITK